MNTKNRDKSRSLEAKAMTIARKLVRDQKRGRALTPAHAGVLRNLLNRG